MEDWNKNQWGGQSSYQPVYEPGPPSNYPGPSGPPPAQSDYAADIKDPYAGGRFAPKKRINDPIFLALFIAQVSVTNLLKFSFCGI